MTLRFGGTYQIASVRASLFQKRTRENTQWNKKSLEALMVEAYGEDGLFGPNLVTYAQLHTLQFNSNCRREEYNKIKRKSDKQR